MTDKHIIESANVFLVSDVKIATEYYRDRLGFRFDRYWGDPPDFCMVWRDGHCVMLSEVGDASRITPVSTVNHVLVCPSSSYVIFFT